jgi:hypothetical protein
MNSIIAEKKFIAERTGIPYANLSQSYLRAETSLGSLSSYDFELQRNNVSSPTVTERLLDLNDEFVITHLTIGLKNVATDTDAEHIVAPIQTYANDETASGNVNPLGDNVEAIFNSSFSLIINRKEFLPEFPVRFFKRVGDTQVTATTQASYGNGLYGFAPFEPVKIDGRQTIDATISVGTGIDLTPAAGINYAVLECRGYLVTNAKS